MPSLARGHLLLPHLAEFGQERRGGGPEDSASCPAYERTDRATERPERHADPATNRSPSERTSGRQRNGGAQALRDVELRLIGVPGPGLRPGCSGGSPLRNPRSGLTQARPHSPPAKGLSKRTSALHRHPETRGGTLHHVAPCGRNAGGRRGRLVIERTRVHAGHNRIEHGRGHAYYSPDDVPPIPVVGCVVRWRVVLWRYA